MFQAQTAKRFHVICCHSVPVQVQVIVGEEPVNCLGRLLVKRLTVLVLACVSVVVNVTVSLVAVVLLKAVIRVCFLGLVRSLAAVVGLILMFRVWVSVSVTMVRAGSFRVAGIFFTICFCFRTFVILTNLLLRSSRAVFVLTGIVASGFYLRSGGASWRCEEMKGRAHAVGARGSVQRSP
jgi:hypothetical protein